MKLKQPVPQSGRNVTHQKLADLPFRSAKALKLAQERIALDVWQKMEAAKVIHEMVGKKEYNFWHEEFKHGLSCYFGDDSESSLVKVYSDGTGIKIVINRALMNTPPEKEAVLETLVRAMSESFATTYYRAKGILHSSTEGLDKISSKN